MKGFISIIVLLLLASADSAGQLSVSFDTAYVSPYQPYRVFAVLRIQNNSPDTVFINKCITETFLFTSCNMNDTMVRDGEINAIMYVNKQRFPDGQNKLLKTKTITKKQYATLALQQQAFYNRNKDLAATDFSFIIQPGRAIKIHTLLISDLMAYDIGFIKKLVKENVEIFYWFKVKYMSGARVVKQEWVSCADPGHFSRAYFEQLSKLK